jgi:adenylate cyclase
MGFEIERKFLLNDDSWREQVVESASIVQGTVCKDGNAITRARIYGGEGFLTVKAQLTDGIRYEYEYVIPLIDAQNILENICKKVLEKTRYIVYVNDLKWEIDVFTGENEGLIVAEVELTDVDQVIMLPLWAGKEVTNDSRYINTNLLNNPYCNWMQINS